MCGSVDLPSPASTLCNECWGGVVFLNQQICIKCGTWRAAEGGKIGNYCADCLTRDWPFETARSVVRYQYPVTDLLHRLKYQGDRRVLRPIGEILAKGHRLQTPQTYDYIIPVPLYTQKLKKRGLNQAALLASLLFRGEPEEITHDLLFRVQNTRSQTGLNGVERRRNLKDAFAVNSKYCLEGVRICLVDDVFTTGTTVSACAETLVKSGVQQVHVLTLARV
ncbi:MAG: ComF family protein [Desulfobulbaceae bacterium]|nr:MAG: ComF family protein [Desulfobulbaceae bacterium]